MEDLLLREKDKNVAGQITKMEGDLKEVVKENKRLEKVIAERGS